MRRKFYINRSLILKGIFIMYIVNFSVCANIDGVSSTSALANCNYLSDCSGLECCIDSAYILGNRSIYFQIKVDCANIEYQIETKSVSKSLTALTVGKVVATEWVGILACKYGVVESTKNIDPYIIIYPIMILLSFN